MVPTTKTAGMEGCGIVHAGAAVGEIELNANVFGSGALEGLDCPEFAPMAWQSETGNSIWK
jgi:hypothetical protein